MKGAALTILVMSAYHFSTSTGPKRSLGTIIQLTLLRLPALLRFKFDEACGFGQVVKDIRDAFIKVFSIV